MDDLIADFITETEEILDRLDADVARLERNSGDSVLIDAMFRELHTIKGSCGFFGLSLIEDRAHDAENILDDFRARRVADTASDIAAFRQSLNLIRRKIEAIPVAGPAFTAADQENLHVRRIDDFYPGLSRIVRNLSFDLKKNADLIIAGGDIILDHGQWKAIRNCLIHLLRNAMAHGIEPPDQRRASGKPDSGHIVIDVARSANEVTIRISDDGRGVTSGAHDPAHRLLFDPGFTTAETLTSVSGRGVGLDSVRAAIASIGGRVAIASGRGQGCTVTLSIPQIPNIASKLSPGGAASARVGPVDARPRSDHGELHE